MTSSEPTVVRIDLITHVAIECGYTDCLFTATHYKRFSRLENVLLVTGSKGSTAPWLHVSCNTPENKRIIEELKRAECDDAIVFECSSTTQAFTRVRELRDLEFCAFFEITHLDYVTWHSSENQYKMLILHYDTERG